MTGCIGIYQISITDHLTWLRCKPIAGRGHCSTFLRMPNPHQVFHFRVTLSFSISTTTSEVCWFSTPMIVGGADGHAEWILK